MSKGHRYITVVIDHDTGRIVWARKGRSSVVVDEFLGGWCQTRFLDENGSYKE